MNIIKLSELKEGESGEVECVKTGRRMRNRLSSLGIIRGTKVICLHRSFSGGMTAYLVKGAVIAIRNGDSSCIFVKSGTFQGINN